MPPPPGLSPATVTPLSAQWQAEHQAFQERDLSGTDYVYVWVDVMSIASQSPPRPGRFTPDEAALAQKVLQQPRETRRVWYE